MFLIKDPWALPINEIFNELSITVIHHRTDETLKNVISTKMIIFYFQGTVMGNINYHHRELCVYCTINYFLFYSIFVPIYKHFTSFPLPFSPLLP